MRKIDKDGLILCDIQSQAFELSISLLDTSSEVFIRRFMNSEIAKDMDNLALLETNVQAKDILDIIENEYGKSDYGSTKYPLNVMHWMGYFYRYFSYTYNKTSKQVYKIIKPKELKGLYMAYHTLDVSQAIERVLEAKGLLSNGDDELLRQFEIYKRIRNKS